MPPPVGEVSPQTTVERWVADSGCLQLFMTPYADYWATVIRELHIACTFNMTTSYQQWVWEREAHINWSMVTCQGSTRSELP